MLKIESIMDVYDPNNSSSTKIPSNAIIETVAESVLESNETLIVIDNKTSQPVGSLNPSKVIKILFGDKEN